MIEIFVNGENLDLTGEDEIVQTFSALNFNNIATRNADYSNLFRVPITNKNLRLISYSNYLNSVGGFPYQKNPCIIYIDGFQFKTGFLDLDEISDKISLRFYTGAINFFSAIKDLSLTTLDLTEYNHYWDLPTVINSRLNTSGYIYPIIDYNGLTNPIDARRLAPAFFEHTLIEKIINDVGYTLVDELETEKDYEYKQGIIPFSKDSPKLPQDIVDANQYEGFLNDIWGGGIVNNTIALYGLNNIFYPFTFGWNDGLRNCQFGNPITNPSNLFSPLYGGVFTTNFTYAEFTSQLSGIYEIDLDISILSTVTHSWSSIPAYDNTFEINLYLEVIGGQNYQLATDSQTYSGIFNGQIRQFTNTLTYTGTTTLFLNAGQKVRINFESNQFLQSTQLYFGAINLSSQTNYFPLNASGTAPGKAHFKIKEEITFGQLVYPNAFLPNIKASDYFKDICFRYGILPVIDEQNKKVILRSFSKLKDNLPIAYDWSDKLDETDDPTINFKLGNYGRFNNVRYKDDDSVPIKPNGSDYVLSIANENLEIEKNLYISPFGASIDKSAFTTENVVYIDMYDPTTLYFTKKVEPRVCYVKKVSKALSYTDGTTTTAVSTDLPFTWFIDMSNGFSMGFSTNLMNRHSSDIIAVLQNQKILKVDIKLNINDLLSIDYYRPVYLKQFSAYFFISSINQYSFTTNKSTEVVLIKLN
jgi:hypothetical protein